MRADDPVAEFKPATDDLIRHLSDCVRKVCGHQHPERGEDLYCLNLTSYMGERMGPVPPITSVTPHGRPDRSGVRSRRLPSRSCSGGIRV